MMYYWLERLKNFKADSDETYKSLSETTGIPQTTVEKIFSGRTHDPKLMIAAKLAQALGHSVSELIPAGDSAVTDDEMGLISGWRELDEEGRSRVGDTLKSELRRVRAEESEQFPCMYYDFPVSAGTGEYLDYNTARIIELKTAPPRGTDFVLRIAGDSMEPGFFDGDLVCVKGTRALDEGDIGIFSYAGNVYMKEYTAKGLRSLNEKYPLIKGSGDIVILGRVLGRADV